MRSLLFFLVIISQVTFAQYQGPITPITSGYGAPGNAQVSVTNIANDHFAFRDISVFHPQSASSPTPTIFFSHGYGGNDTSQYIETLRHLASRGYVVVFVPYRTLGVSILDRYTALKDGFRKAVDTLNNIIDTTRVGFYGHSFGGGATPSISHQSFTQNNWGAKGRFIYCSAPWYSFQLDDSKLASFPKDCNMLMLLYNNDATNDHRMGMDVFNNIAINDSLKDCLFVSSDTINGFIYDANHNLPGQGSKAEFNAFDYYVTFRLLDAMADYSFTGNQTAKKIALGNGGAEQIDMGQLKPLFHSDAPTPFFNSNLYRFPCDSSINERQAYCAPPVSTLEFSENLATIKIYPNPVRNILSLNTTNLDSVKSVTIYTMQGTVAAIYNESSVLNVSQLKPGRYLLKVITDKQAFTSSFIKQ